MTRHIFLLIAALSLMVHTPAAAYGQYGHGVIARIALINVKPATRAAVRAMLARSALLDTPTCRAITPEDASVWPDCIRAMGDRFSYTAPWHYQNVDVCKPFDLKSACANGNCVSTQISRQVKLLQDRTIPPREKIAALIFLIHFVGDLHMPLHAGDRSDRGGNDVRVAYGLYAPDWLNLHGVWDGAIAERALTTPPSLERRYADADRVQTGVGTVEDWSRESWQVSRDTAYALALGGNACGPKPAGRLVLSNEVIARYIAPQRLQVERAGLRLARLLDEAFDPANAFTPKQRR